MRATTENIYEVAAKAAEALAAARWQQAGEASRLDIQARLQKQSQERAREESLARQQSEAERELKRQQHASEIAQQAVYRNSKERKRAEKVALKKRTEQEAAAMLDRIASGQPRPKPAVDSASRRSIPYVKTKVFRTGEVTRDGKYRAG